MADSKIKDVVKDAIKKYSKLNNTDLGKLLAKKYPKIFSNPEAARASIRYYKGANGPSSRIHSSVEYSKLSNAKILVFDIETAPLISYHWRRWQQDIHGGQVIADNWPILTWSAKWLFDNKIHSMKMTPKEAINRNDKRVVQGLWNMIDEADILIAHNGIKFDVRMMNGRFFLNGITPPSSYQIIDTLRAARKAIAVPSYKLDDLAKYLGLETKIKTDFSWWKKFMEGDQDAIDKMQIYNDKDVEILEEVYFALRPWIRPHPNLGLFVPHGDSVCPACASTELSIIGEYATYVNLYDEYKCGNCGHTSRRRQSTTPVRSNKQITVSIPK